MKMKKVGLLFVCCFALLVGYAQQLPQYTYFTYNYMNYNPAVTGFTECLELKFGYRRQWQGFEGAPRTGFANVHGRFGKKKFNYHGVGAFVESDNAGPFGYTSLFANYAYHMRMAKKYMLSAGIGIGFMQYRVSFSEMLLENQDNDPAIFGNVSQMMFPLVNAGLWLYRADRFFGFSIRQLRQTPIEDLGNSQIRRHLTFAFGKSIRMAEDLSFKPAFLLNYVGRSRPSLEAQAIMAYKDKVSAGLAARSGHGLSALLKIDAISYITIAYAYDLTLNKVRFPGASSHEITIGLKACPSGGSNYVPCAAYD
jgi:type IX secretion system PorP/SprF family membrane protein